MDCKEYLEAALRELPEPLDRNALIEILQTAIEQEIADRAECYERGYEDGYTEAIANGDNFLLE